MLTEKAYQRECRDIYRGRMALKKNREKPLEGFTEEGLREIIGYRIRHGLLTVVLHNEGYRPVPKDVGDGGGDVIFWYQTEEPENIYIPFGLDPENPEKEPA